MLNSRKMKLQPFHLVPLAFHLVLVFAALKCLPSSSAEHIRIQTLMIGIVPLLSPINILSTKQPIPGFSQALTVPCAIITHAKQPSHVSLSP
jgi:hypothetical protein